MSTDDGSPMVALRVLSVESQMREALAKMSGRQRLRHPIAWAHSLCHACGVSGWREGGMLVQLGLNLLGVVFVCELACLTFVLILRFF
jgi:hypothetical protein